MKKTETIYFGKDGTKLAIQDNIYSSKMKDESHWYSESIDGIQVAKMNYNKGKVFKNHSHNKYDRVINKTQECLLVATGKAKVKLFDDNKQHVSDVTLLGGDFLILLNGFHELSIELDETRLMEFKNGPFTSVEKDKTYYED